jgi:hypothetical protein
MRKRRRRRTVSWAGGEAEQPLDGAFGGRLAATTCSSIGCCWSISRRGMLSLGRCRRTIFRPENTNRRERPTRCCRNLTRLSLNSVWDMRNDQVAPTGRALDGQDCSLLSSPRFGRDDRTDLWNGTGLTSQFDVQHAAERHKDRSHAGAWERGFLVAGPQTLKSGSYSHAVPNAAGPQTTR